MSNKTLSTRSKYRPEIDGLRAFAVVAVIINHFNKDLLPSGYLGVDIFFVISGYVITSSLAQRNSKNFLDFVTGFYERRIKRLVPVMVVFVLITSIMISMFNPDPEVALSLGWRTLLGVSNIQLFRTSTDYFAESTEFNPFTHTWSLGVEEQFYLLFPFLIWFSGFGQRTTRGARNLFFSVGILSIASLVSFIYLYQVNQPAAYFLMPARFWEMAAGCLIFVGFQKRTKIEQALEKVPPLLVVAAMVGVMFLPVTAAVPATVGVVVLSAILTACLKKGSAAYQLFTLKKVVYLGLISYSLYLWHWSVLCISRWTIGVHWWTIPIQVGLMLVMARGSYEWIEKPLRQAEWSMQCWRTVGIGLCAAGSVGLLILGYGRMAKSHLIFLGSKTKSSHEIDLVHLPRRECNIFEDYTKAVELASECGETSFKGRPTLYSLGDSHSKQFNEFLAEYARQKHYNYIFVWGNFCLFPSAVIRKGGEICFERQRLIEKKMLHNLKQNDIVFIGNALYRHFNREWNDEKMYYTRDGAPLTIDDAAKIFSQRFQKLSNIITSKGARVVFYINGVQFPKHDAPGSLCKKEWFRPEYSINSGCFANLEDHKIWLDQNFSWRKTWNNGKTKIAWNTYEDNSCPAHICDATLYTDSNHFKREFAAYLFFVFVQKHPDLFLPARN